MSTHRPIFCGRCRAQILIPNEMPAPPAPWVVRDDRAPFCSVTCAEQGLPLPVRPQVHGFIRFSPGTTPLQIMGTYDALAGLDVLSQDPKYIAGHLDGMTARPIIEAAMETITLAAMLKEAAQPKDNSDEFLRSPESD